MDNFEFNDQKIFGVELAKEVKTAFIDYSMSVIMSRALPDVRDGLKPVHRRILYAMYEDNLTYANPFRKSATTVGDVLGRYHPHGDAAVYDTMVRMAQSFSLRYPLIEGQGNFGNIDGDKAAAYRYTEAKMARLTDDMMSDIDKDVVDFSPNFDNKRKEPTVLPSRFPNLLVNGSMGIAVGMATNIPPHNLCEVVDGIDYLMEHPEATLNELMTFIKGPDFPTGAMINGTAGIYEAYATGHGRVYVRAKAEVNEEKRTIIVTEIPYAVNKQQLVEAIAACVKEKKVDGITALRDESSQRNGLRIVIEFRRDANGSVILNQLYKHTQLQGTCAINMLALVDNVPKILTLKQMLGYYIDHQETVIKRRTVFELNRAMHEMHIFEGYKIAIDNIDRVIDIIRASASVSDAKANLVAEFALSDEQAQAIVDMTLGKLSGLERQKIEDRLEKLRLQIEELNGILADESKIKEIIKNDLAEIKRRFGDARRTEIHAAENEIILENLIERHTCVITMTHSGYIKRLPSDTYSSQRRGGKGIIGMATKDEDFVERVITADSHSFILLFTNTGKIHVKKTYQIPEASRTAKGTNIVNVIELEAGETVTALISVGGFNEGEYLTMVTKCGVIKRTELSEYEIRRRGGKIAINLDPDDELVFVKHTKGTDELIVATGSGLAVRFAEGDVRVMGRTARGVRGIRLDEGDYVTGVAVVNDELKLLTITENGFGKRSDFEAFSAHKRGGKGVVCHNINEKTGKLSGIAAVSESDDVMLITNDGTIIRTPVSGIPIYSRSAGGVIVMRPAEGAYIVNFARVDGESSDDGIDSETDTEAGTAGDGNDGNDDEI